jgi:hypothetical protein
MPLISDNSIKTASKHPPDYRPSMTHASPSCLLIQLPIPARRGLPVEGNIGCLFIRYVLVFDIFHTAVPRDGISFIGYRERGQVR